MYFLNCLTFLILGNSFLISCVKPPSPSSSTSVSLVTANLQSKNLQNSRKANVPVTVKLLPYEILAGKPASYADVSLTISNVFQRNIEVEVTQIEIVTADSEQVLMSSTHQNLGLPAKLSLQPGENRVLEYRLKSKSGLYQRGQDVIARIRYLQDGQTEQVVQSTTKGAGFLIP